MSKHLIDAKGVTVDAMSAGFTVTHRGETVYYDCLIDALHEAENIWRDTGILEKVEK